MVPFFIGITITSPCCSEIISAGTPHSHYRDRETGCNLIPSWYYPRFRHSHQASLEIDSISFAEHEEHRVRYHKGHLYGFEGFSVGTSVTCNQNKLVDQEVEAGQPESRSRRTRSSVHLFSVPLGYSIDPSTRVWSRENRFCAGTPSPPRTPWGHELRGRPQLLGDPPLAEEASVMSYTNAARSNL